MKVKETTGMPVVYGAVGVESITCLCRQHIPLALI